jgi:uncharacterized damage-inducible protein DinB
LERAGRGFGPRVAALVLVTTLGTFSSLHAQAVPGCKRLRWSIGRFDYKSRRDGMGRRAESFAARIEEGAAGLAAFAEGLSEAEWGTPISATDRRTVGQVVNHVALVYPVEIDLARSIADGKAVTDVTWQVVAELNANHAREHSKVTKAAALDLLRQNSRQAAEAVRAFSDEQLDRAAPFSLSFGAPVTAQFVLEDHAVRHSWHHLARIRTTVGR